MDATTNRVGGEALGSAGLRRKGPLCAPGWWEYLGASGTAKVLVLAGLLGWMYHDHILRLFYYWCQPDWSHGFLIPFFCLYLVNMKRGALLAEGPRGSPLGLALMLLSTATYVLAVRMKIGYPQPLTIVSMLAGMALLLGGWRVLRLTLFPICFLVLAMPPPERVYREITQPLQQGAAFAATAVLNAFPKAEVERSGVNISYWVAGHGSGTFTVAGACSGMRSLMAFVALGLAMAYITPRPLWQRLATAAAVVPVALFCNVLRVIATGALQMYGHNDLAEGTPHMVLGLCTFALGFFIFLGWLWMLDHVWVDVSATSTAEALDRLPPVKGEGGCAASET